MRHARPLRRAALVGLAVLASACSDTTAPADQPAGLSEVLAEMQPAALAGVIASLSPAPVAGLGAPVPSSCRFDAAAKSFTCPTVSVSGLSVSRTFTLFDANGAPQSAFDRTTTSSVRMETSLAGSIASGTSTMSLDQRQDYTLSGLLTGVHALNGSSLGHLNGSLSNGSLSTPIASTITTTVSNLVLPRGSTGTERFPASGTLSAVTQTTIGALPMMTTNVLVAFNGSSKAAVTITTGAHTSQCTVDLTRAAATLCSS